MTTSNLKTIVEDHALDAVPRGHRENWLRLTWNTVGIVTTLVILFFGALVCFVAGVKIALIAGVISFAFGSLLGWGLSHIACSTGYSNTLITRKYGLGVKGSILASLIFCLLITGMLALENALLYRGILFFFEFPDTAGSRIVVYALLTSIWILVTTLGFRCIARFSSWMLITFLFVLSWILGDILTKADVSLADMALFSSQATDDVLQTMGILSDWDKFVFSMNILFGPACALPLVAVDYGRYAKSTGHAATSVVIGAFFQSVVVMLIGGILMYAAADKLASYFMESRNLSVQEAGDMVLGGPYSIAATFMIFGGFIGFLLMIVAQAKAQVLNCYSASLSLANLFDALSDWRPGRFVFVIIANVIALAMLYGQILELVEAYTSFLGVLLSALAGVILMDYYVTNPLLARSMVPSKTNEKVNWAGVTTILLSVITAQSLLTVIIPLKVVTSCLMVVILYPVLRLLVFRPARAKLSGA